MLFSPRYIIENIGFIFLAIISYILAGKENNTNNILPVLGTFAVAAQKLLPSMQQCYNSIGTIRSNKSSVEKVINILNQKNEFLHLQDIKSFNFKNKIKFSNVSFKYPKSNKLILENIDLEINKGDRIGIIGKTGSGKSTLTDILMGLLKPNSGIIGIDNVNLYSKKNSRYLIGD